MTQPTTHLGRGNVTDLDLVIERHRMNHITVTRPYPIKEEWKEPLPKLKSWTLRFSESPQQN